MVEIVAEWLTYKNSSGRRIVRRVEESVGPGWVAVGVPSTPDVDAELKRRVAVEAEREHTKRLYRVVQGAFFGALKGETTAVKTDKGMVLICPLPEADHDEYNSVTIHLQQA